MRSERKLSSTVLTLFAVGWLLTAADAFALPVFMMRYSQDLFSRSELRFKCSTCHINEKGSGPRTPFGAAFEKNKHTVTAEFRTAWPEYFLPNVSTNSLPTSGGELKATLLSNNQDAVLDIDGQHYRLDLKTAKLEKIESTEAAKIVEAPPPPLVEPKLPLKDQPTFDHYLVNLPTTLPYNRGTLSMRFTHRFESAVLGCGTSCAGIGQLYGLDGFSISSFGGEYGITRRLAATVYRSPLEATIEMGGIFQLLRQRGKEPISASFRVTVEGRDNFQDHYTTNLVLPLSRAISNVAEIFVDPMFSFNANPLASQALPTDPIGVRRRNQAAVGLGASIRFRPRSAFIMDWTPRVGGYHPMDSRNAYSFGIQRTTNGHVFELVLTNSLGTTTSRAVNFASDQFALGFNIYRRLRGPSLQ